MLVFRRVREFFCVFVIVGWRMSDKCKMKGIRKKSVLFVFVTRVFFFVVRGGMEFNF